MTAVPEIAIAAAEARIAELEGYFEAFHEFERSIPAREKELNDLERFVAQARNSSSN